MLIKNCCHYICPVGNFLSLFQIGSNRRALYSTSSPLGSCTNLIWLWDKPIGGLLMASLFRPDLCEKLSKCFTCKSYGFRKWKGIELTSRS